MTAVLRGLTWDHPRGYRVLDALAGALGPEITVRWDRQPLEDFESRPLRTLADDYDLLVVDHPGLGEAVRDGALRPMHELFSRPSWPAGGPGRPAPRSTATGSGGGSGRCRWTPPPRCRWPGRT